MTTLTPSSRTSLSSSANATKEQEYQHVSSNYIISTSSFLPYMVIVLPYIHTCCMPGRLILKHSGSHCSDMCYIRTSYVTIHEQIRLEQLLIAIHIYFDFIGNIYNPFLSIHTYLSLALTHSSWSPLYTLETDCLLHRWLSDYQSGWTAVRPHSNHPQP